MIIHNLLIKNKVDGVNFLFRSTKQRLYLRASIQFSDMNIVIYKYYKL